MFIKTVAILLVAILGVVKSIDTNRVIEVIETDFQQLTNITINQQHGTITSTKNSLVYFFISGQQTQPIYQKTRTQFQTTAISYFQSKEKSINIDDNLIWDEQIINQSQPALIQDKQSIKTTNSQNLKSIHFYAVKCPNNTENTDSKVHICTNLGIYETKQNQFVFFFTSNSQILKFNEQITENNLFLLISKIQENTQFFETLVTFDEELEKMASKFELKNISLKNKAFGLIEQIKSYLTWDLLKFLVIFGVLPFLFGYLNSKSQQKANKQRMQKYAANTQEQVKNKTKELKEEKKD